MADDIKQPVVTDDKSAAQPAPATNDAPDLESLDSLLKQYDEATRQPAEAAPAATPDKTKTEEKPKDSTALLERMAKVVEEQEADSKRKAIEKANNEFNDTVKRVMGDLPDTPTMSKLVRGWIKDTADGDKRLQRAWDNRHTDPQGWTKVEDALKKACAKEFSELQRRPDAAATEDREAVTASLRGASTAPPPAKEPDVARMSDAEHRKHVREKYGYEPHF